MSFWKEFSEYPMISPGVSYNLSFLSVLKYRVMSCTYIRNQTTILLGVINFKFNPEHPNNRIDSHSDVLTKNVFPAFRVVPPLVNP